MGSNPTGSTNKEGRVMTRFNGIRCDVCGGVDDVGNSQTIPFGWIAFAHAGKDIEVCGLKCFNKWGRERSNLEKELEKLGPEEFCKVHCEHQEGDEQQMHNDVCPKAKAWVR